MSLTVVKDRSRTEDSDTAIVVLQAENAMELTDGKAKKMAADFGTSLLGRRSAINFTDPGSGVYSVDAAGNAIERDPRRVKDRAALPPVAAWRYDYTVKAVP